MSGSEEGSWRTVCRPYAPGMERDDQLGRRNSLRGRVMLEAYVFGGQCYEAKRVDVENAVLVARGHAAVFVRSLASVVIMIMHVHRCVVIRIGMARQSMDAVDMPLRKLVHMRRLGGGCSGPDKRCDHKGQHNAASESHSKGLHVQRFLRHEQVDGPANRQRPRNARPFALCWNCCHHKLMSPIRSNRAGSSIRSCRHSLAS